jgi:SAM-dependent methyltransferase
MFSDPWLTRWMPLIVEHSGQTPVLEIGCGYGDDTVTLTKAGLDVIAFDLSPACVAAAKLRAPRAHIECRDTRTPFPDRATKMGAVVASLSLHYFPWLQTTAIVQRVWDCLAPGGILLCRLNSTEDRHFGAGSGIQMEANFYRINGVEKRFFDRAAVERLFATGWHPLSVEHMISGKYLQPKAAWEVVLQKNERISE